MFENWSNENKDTRPKTTFKKQTSETNKQKQNTTVTQTTRKR